MNVQENFLARFRFYAFSPSSLKASIENAHTKACVCAQKVRGKREALSYAKICIHSSTWENCAVDESESDFRAFSFAG